MARKTKEDAEKTRQQIIASALDIISERGFANTSLEQIAKNAGVTRGAIYWHFKNKVDLFTALFEAWITPSNDLAVDHLVTKAPSLNHLKRYMIEWLTHIEAQPSTQKLFNIIFFKVEQVGDIKTLIEQANIKADQDLKALQLYLGVLKENKELHPNLDIALFATIISSFLMGLAQNWLARPNDYSLMEVAPQLIEQFLSGYLP